jgi:hypothetical protein
MDLRSRLQEVKNILKEIFQQKNHRFNALYTVFLIYDFDSCLWKFKK